jgi:hypothetical protein
MPSAKDCAALRTNGVLISREQRPDGRYHLKYGNHFNGGTYNGAVRKWLEGLRRAQEKGSKKLGV